MAAFLTLADTVDYPHRFVIFFSKRSLQVQAVWQPEFYAIIDGSISNFS